MKYRILFVLLILLKAFSSFASGTDTVKIFYPINKYALSPADQIKLHHLVDSLNDHDTIQVLGYADYLGDSKYNLVLSANRAETIKKYLLSLNSKLQIFTDGKGTVQATTEKTPEGEPANRRVDIIKPRKAGILKIVAAQPIVKPVEAPKIKPTELPTSRPAEVKPDSARPKMPEISAVHAEPKDNQSFSDKINSLEKLDVGSSISLEELTFQPGRHFLNPEAVPYVNRLLNYLKKHKNIVFEIQGHICCDYAHFDGLDFDTGDQTLSNNRAKFIYDFFVKNGISADRMTYKGLGSSKPRVYPERTERDRTLNRRVEIMIVDK